MTSRVKPKSVKRTIVFGNLELGSSSAISKCSDVLKITLFSGRGITTNPQVRLYPLASANLKCSDSTVQISIARIFLKTTLVKTLVTGGPFQLFYCCM